MKWMMLSSWALLAKKRLKHSFGGTADVILSEASKHQPSCWKEWSQLLPEPMQIYCQCYCLCLWSHAVNGIWGVIWAKNKPLLLPSQKKKKSWFWHCLGHRIAVWALDPVCTSVRQQQGREGHSGAGGSGVLSATVLLRAQMQWHLQPFVLLPITETQLTKKSLPEHGRKRCTIKQFDKNSPKIICFQSGSESWVVLNMLWFLRCPCVLQELSCKQLAFNSF